MRAPIRLRLLAPIATARVLLAFVSGVRKMK